MLCGQERNLTHSCHLRPIYLRNQWAFKNSPAHISFSVMVIRCFVLWFCGLWREPCFSANDDISIGKRKLTAFTLPLEKKMRNHYKYYKCIKLAEKVKTKHQPNPAGKKCFQPLHAAGGRISCHSHGDPKGPSTVLSAGSICLFPLCLASLCQCLTCVYKAVCAQNPGGASAPTETLQ